MKPVVYEKIISVPQFLGDRYGRVNLQNLMNIFIQVSGEQTVKTDLPAVSDFGLKWVIIQYDIQVNRMPNTSEEVKVRTFIKEHNRVFSYREFELYDADGNLLVYVMTVFALINEKRKISSIPKEIVKGYGSTENRRIRRLPKPESPEKNAEIKQKEYDVGYFDIDQNFHANNSMYFVWMLDVLGDEFLATHDVISGNIMYEKEIYMDKKVESSVDFKMDEEENVVSRHQIEVDGNSKATGNFVWKTNDIDYEKDIRNLENNGAKD